MWFLIGYRYPFINFGDMTLFLKPDALPTELYIHMDTIRFELMTIGVLFAVSVKKFHDVLKGFEPILTKVLLHTSLNYL